MKYIIITPAFNEENYIGQTIDSVISQTIRPLFWMIVDDGSIDSTADIIKDYASRYSWIRYVFRKRELDQSYYASNVYAIQEGIKQSREFDYDFVAILDADITLPQDYYQKIKDAFDLDPKLGIASGNCADVVDGELEKHLYDRRSCAKAIMVFKKECYEQIGGFVPMKYGGEDTVACFTARMLGWKTWAFHEILVSHNKPLGTGPTKNILKIRFRQGISEYSMGSAALFVIMKSLRRCVRERPLIVGGLARMAGFLYGCCSRPKRQIPDDVIRFIRQEQMTRLFNMNRVPKDYKVGSI